VLYSEGNFHRFEWHHIGLVYGLGGFCSRLYVDGVEVAMGINAVAGAHSDGGLYIGAGEDLDPTTFWSGLVDDVRIYNRAVKS